MHDVFWYGWKDMGRLDELAFRASNECKTEYFWMLHEAVDYTDFDLNFLPDRYQRKMLHAWPAHNNPKAYTTWLINSQEILVGPEKVYHEELLPSHAPPIGKDLEGVHWEIDERIDYSDFDFDWLPDHWSFNARHTFCLKHKNSLGYTHLLFDGRHPEDARLHASDLVLKDHYEITELRMVDNRLPREGARSQRFVGNMEAALRTAIRKAKREWLWVISDIIDYDFQGFDFEWLPDGDQRHFVHCWPSNSQIKGETFLIHVPTYEDSREFEFCFEHRPLARMDWPAQPYGVDSLAQAIRIHGTKALYTQFTHMSVTDLGQPYPCLWDERPVIAMNKSGSCSLVPRDCVVKREIYEYPHLERNGTLATDPEMDVIFISNGEQQAAINRIRLNMVLNRNAIGYRFAKDVSDVKGRLNSYRAAAQKSSTDWFIAVFAKCHVTEELSTLNENWTPDYWQEPKHYIFHNHNMDNGLTYGHMAPIAYNRNLLLDNPGGLDITLSQPHTVVPIVLSQTSLGGDDWTDWRTAFRETVKLLYYNNTSPTIDSEYRLHSWLNKGTPCSIKGAQDGKDFYERCGGEEAWLLQTVEWDWLRKYYNSLYS